MSVTMPSAWWLPRSASFVTTAWLMSTQNVSTQAGRMLPTAMAWSVDAGDDIGQRPVVADRAGEHERDRLADALVHHAARDVPAFDGRRDRPAAPDLVDDAQVVAVPVLGRHARIDGDAERGAQHVRL